MSSLRYFSLHNINLESSLSFLHPDNTIGNELNGLPTFFSLLSDSNAPCVVILGSTFPCEHCCASPHLCLARFSNVRPVCVVFPLDYVQWRYEMDSFVSLYPIFHALVFLKLCLCLAFVVLRMSVCCIIGHIPKPLVVAVPGLQHARPVSKYKFLLPIHTLGSAHTARSFT